MIFSFIYQPILMVIMTHYFIKLSITSKVVEGQIRLTIFPVKRNLKIRDIKTTKQIRVRIFFKSPLIDIKWFNGTNLIPKYVLHNILKKTKVSKCVCNVKVCINEVISLVIVKIKRRQKTPSKKILAYNFAYLILNLDKITLFLAMPR